MRTRLIFVRHAEAQGNYRREFHGWTDEGITEMGHKQAKKVAERLMDTSIDVLYSSSMIRTIESAEYISKIKQLPINRTDKLKEINGGDWEGKRWENLPELWPEEYKTWENMPHKHRMPNGESMEEFQSRLLEEIDYIIKKHKGKNICIFTHGTAMKAMTCAFRYCGLDEILKVEWCDNTAITIVDYEDERFNIVLEGDSSHLDKETSTLLNQEWYIEYKQKLEVQKMVKQKLTKYLFETRAFRICPEDSPFWYTSGRIGPYYINTHFLYGSEVKANDLLKMIDELKTDKKHCPLTLTQEITNWYQKNEIFKSTIDIIVDYIRENIPLDEVKYISGGERRDWFFSLLTANLLDKPHITIYKDMDIIVTYKNEITSTDDLKGASVLHIADLITAASSYERAWVPAIKSNNGDIKWSLSVVDRLQGGSEVLNSLGIESHSMISIDNELFDLALEEGYINQGQYQMVLSYYNNPEEAMEKFLEKHPEFFLKSLESEEKTANRARLCLENNFYNCRKIVEG